MRATESPFAPVCLTNYIIADGNGLKDSSVNLSETGFQRSPALHRAYRQRSNFALQLSLKGTELSGHSQAYFNKVTRQLKERPRETLQFVTPAERFNACVASPVEPVANRDQPYKQKDRLAAG